MQYCVFVIVSMLLHVLWFIVNTLFDLSDPEPSCELYTGSVCYARGVIGKDYVFINNTQISSTDQAYWEDAMVNFKSSLETSVQSAGAPQSCVDDMLSLLCFHIFPVCDYSSNTSVPRQVRR